MLTSNGPSATTTSVVVHDNRIALNNTVHGEIASIAGVRNLSVLETLDGYLDCVNCRSSGLEYVHA